jgi:hypothetical protein
MTRLSASRIAVSTRLNFDGTRYWHNRTRAAGKAPVIANSAIRVCSVAIVAEDPLEVGEAVVAAETGVVTEEQQHEGVVRQVMIENIALDPRLNAK